MPQSHGVVWMDSKEAHIFRFGAEDVKMERVKAHNPFRKVHHKAGAIGAGRAAADLSYFDHIADALRGTREWLLTGPAQAKNDFIRHIEAHMPQLKAKLVGVEAMDHPTDAELVAHARSYFKAVDKMQSNSPAPPGHGASA
jgi:stalled ribosome rescue protein Dom34